MGWSGQADPISQIGEPDMRRDAILQALFAGVYSITLLLVAGAAPVRAQGDADAALKDRVLQLVDRLDGEKVEARDTATASLIKLGPKVLPLLPDVATVTSKERKERLGRIREALTAKQGELNTGASKVTLIGKGVRLSEALQQLQKQTGNAITDLREQLGVDVTNPALDLELRDKPFFEALDQVARQAEIGITFATGDGSIGIVAGASMAAAAGDKPAPKGNPLIIYSGPFRIQLHQLSISRDFGAGTALANARLEAAWEPRLRPMLLKLDAEEMKIVDDRKKDVKPQVAAESDEVVIRPENPSSEINLNLEAPDRDAKKIASLRVKAEVTIPAGIRIFKFPSLAQKDVTVKQGDVSLTLEDTEIDEQVWKVNVTLAYPGEGPAFESYRQGLFNNRIWLQRADGSRFEHNGGFNNTGSDGGKLAFEYLFVDAPGKPADYQLIYETPSKVITIPLEFEFKDVTLP
jgi:hypothetical protein